MKVCVRNVLGIPNYLFKCYLFSREHTRESDYNINQILDRDWIRLKFSGSFGEKLSSKDRNMIEIINKFTWDEIKFNFKVSEISFV